MSQKKKDRWKMKKYIFKASYGRKGEMWIEKGTCHICHKKKMCLKVDSSEEEYGAGQICWYCVDKLFEEDEDEEV